MEAEILATSAVKKRIAQTKYLSPFINEGDKEPSWDGFIYAYKDETKRKDRLTGRAAVQVKGLQRKNLRQKSISYSMERADIENYRTDGGVILFVVYIDSDMQEKIYYASLTPFYLNEVLRVASHGKRKPKLSLRSLPDSADELCNIVFNFIRDSKKQGIVRNGHIWTFEEVAKLFGQDNIELNFTYTGIGYDKSDPFSFLSKNEVYMYAQNKDKTLTIPLQHIEHFDMQVQERMARITAGDVDYDEKITFSQYSDGKIVLTIGKSLKFISEKKKSVFKYTLAGNLDERIRAIELLIAMVAEKSINVNATNITLNPAPKELELFDLEERKKQLKYYRLIKETLDKLNVERSLEVDKLTEKEENNLRMLVNAVMYGRTASFKEKGYIPAVCTMDFANLKIVLAFRQEKDGRYTVEDFFNTSMVCVIDKIAEYQTTPFCILHKEDYLHDDNLVLDRVIDGFKQYDNKGHLEKLVLCILEMIKAYDADESKKELLAGAKELCAWMEEKKPDDIIHRINYLQCCKRERELTNEEIDELSEIVVNKEADNVLLAGIHILLGSKNMAKKYMEMLNEEQIKEFKKYPIYTLYERM